MPEFDGCFGPSFLTVFQHPKLMTAYHVNGGVVVVIIEDQERWFFFINTRYESIEQYGCDADGAFVDWDYNEFHIPPGRLIPIIGVVF